jgi:DivIVA domain-containing protein
MAGGVMGLLFLAVGVAVIAGAALLIAGRWREGLPDVTPEGSPPAILPSDVPLGSLTAADMEGVRLEQAVRGYRMDDVDALVDRLTQEIEVRDAEIARLRAEDDPRPRADDGA